MNIYYNFHYFAFFELIKRHIFHVERKSSDVFLCSINSAGFHPRSDVHWAYLFGKGFLTNDFVCKHNININTSRLVKFCSLLYLKKKNTRLKRVIGDEKVLLLKK